MSKFVSDISSIFPGVSWHGQSKIHTSVFMEGVLSVPFEDRANILFVLSQQNVGGLIWDSLMTRFGKFEWLLDKETFAKLFLVDVDLHLQGKKSSPSPNQIVNPATGNFFHRIALLPPYVGGVRFWAEDYFNSTSIGFRFRIVKMLDEAEEIDVRAEAREREAQVILEMASVYDAIMDISEPPVSVTNAVAGLVHCFQ